MLLTQFQIVENMLNMFIKQMMVKSIRRQFVRDNEIVNEQITKLKTQFQKQESEMTSSEGEIQESKEGVNVEENIRNISKENSNSNVDSIEDNDSGYDSDEPLGGGDGGGGGILGLLAGLSGGVSFLFVSFNLLSTTTDQCYDFRKMANLI